MRGRRSRGESSSPNLLKKITSVGPPAILGLDHKVCLPGVGEDDVFRGAAGSVPAERCR